MVSIEEIPFVHLLYSLLIKIYLMANVVQDTHHTIQAEACVRWTLLVVSISPFSHIFIQCHDTGDSFLCKVAPVCSFLIFHSVLSIMCCQRHKTCCERGCVV